MLQGGCICPTNEKLGFTLGRLTTTYLFMDLASVLNIRDWCAQATFETRCNETLILDWRGGMGVTGIM